MVTRRFREGAGPRDVFVADLGGTKLSAAILDEKGRISLRRIVPVDTTSAVAPVLQIRRLAEEFSGKAGPGNRFAAAAVAVPGLVRRNGEVWAPNLPGWERMPLARRLERILGTSVVVESDRNAAVLGEYWRGEARGMSDAIVLIAGTGIGAGILAGNRIVRGAHELSGCAGWMVVSDQRERHTRRLGQLESLAAGPAIVRAAERGVSSGKRSRLQKLDSSRVTASDVAAAARAGDALSLEVFREAGQLLGRAVANLVSLFDPQIVIIGGGLANAADLYLNSLKLAVRNYAQPVASKRVRIAVSKIGADANLLGCAYLAREAANLS